MSYLPTAVRLSALRRIAIVALGVVLSVGVQVIPAARSLPDDATFVEAAEFSYPYVKIGNQVLRLAAGARIYNEQNLIVMPVAAPSTVGNGQHD